MLSVRRIQQRYKHQHQMYSNSPRFIICITLIQLLCYYTNVVIAGAGIMQRPCTNDTDCQKFQLSSICLAETNTCSNPYYTGGCLATWKRRHQAIHDQQEQQQHHNESSSNNPHNDTTTTNTGTDGTTNTNTDTSSILESNLHKLISYEYMRVCSSVDDAIQQQSKSKVHVHSHSSSTTGSSSDINCVPSSLWNYTEIRLSGNNWESVFFETWIVQIILSELLHVPTSVDTGKFDTVIDFYDPNNRVQYGIGFDWDGLRLARNVSDCRTVKQPPQKQPQPTSSPTIQTIPTNQTNTTKPDDDDGYISCAHVSLEAWEGQLQNLQQLQEDDVIEKPSSLGVLGNGGWYIPWFTGSNDTTLLTYLGMQGEENRRKLAETFLRPTKWIDYCTQVSTTNCTIPDAVAQRGPTALAEESMMFLSGQYTGYFRATEENDCGTVENPKNCTGHIVDYPRGWSSFIQQQTHHLNIALASSGDEPVCRGYTYNQMLEIWQAANATKSHIIMLYWTPEALFETFAGTDSEFIKVSLPRPTQQCFDNRVSSLDRCNPDDITKRIGNSLGSCDDQPQILLKVITNNLMEISNNPNVANAIHSPAYELIKNFEISALQVGVIFDKWINGRTITIDSGTTSSNGTTTVDRYDAREAVCEWVIENMDYIETLLPKTYPRIHVSGESFAQEALFYIALLVSVASLVFLLCVIGYVYKIRTRRAIVAAQIEFLFLVLFGFLLVLIGAVSLAVPPTDVACSFATWLIHIGYTIELASLVVKVAAINRLMTAARQLRRVKLNRVHLLMTVAIVSLLMIVFLSVWTIIDPVRKGSEHELTNSLNDNNEVIVKVYSYCHNNGSWALAALAMRSLMLLSATVLAFQTRNCPTKINESRTLAFMVYSQFSFLVWSVVLFFLRGTIKASNVERYQSIVHSVDVVIACCIYCLPKMTLSDDSFNEMINRECMGHSLAVSRRASQNAANKFFNELRDSSLQPSDNFTASLNDGAGPRSKDDFTKELYQQQKHEQQLQRQKHDSQKEKEKFDTSRTSHKSMTEDEGGDQHYLDCVADDDGTCNTIQRLEQYTDSTNCSSTLPNKIEGEISSDEDSVEFHGESLMDNDSDDHYEHDVVEELLSNDNPPIDSSKESTHIDMSNDITKNDPSHELTKNTPSVNLEIVRGNTTVQSSNDLPSTESIKNITNTNSNSRKSVTIVDSSDKIVQVESSDDATNKNAESAKQITSVLPRDKERNTNRLSLFIKAPTLLNRGKSLQQQQASLHPPQSVLSSSSATGQASSSSSLSAFVSWFRKDKDGNITCNVTYLDDETGRTKEMLLSNKSNKVANGKISDISPLPDSDDNDDLDDYDDVKEEIQDTEQPLIGKQGSTEEVVTIVSISDNVLEDATYNNNNNNCNNRVTTNGSMIKNECSSID